MLKYYYVYENDEGKFEDEIRREYLEELIIDDAEYYGLSYKDAKEEVKDRKRQARQYGQSSWDLSCDRGTLYIVDEKKVK